MCGAQRPVLSAFATSTHQRVRAVRGARRSRPGPVADDLAGQPGLPEQPGVPHPLAAVGQTTGLGDARVAVRRPAGAAAALGPPLRGDHRAGRRPRRPAARTPRPGRRALVGAPVSSRSRGPPPSPTPAQVLPRRRCRRRRRSRACRRGPRRTAASGTQPAELDPRDLHRRRVQAGHRGGSRRGSGLLRLLRAARRREQQQGDQALDRRRDEARERATGRRFQHALNRRAAHLCSPSGRTRTCSRAFPIPDTGHATA